MAADHTGTWKLNLQKSTLRNANLASETLTIEKTGPTSFRTTIDDTLISGEKLHRVYDRTYDGKERSASGPGITPSSEICEFVIGKARRITMKTNGNITTIIDSIVSADGQTLTNLREDAQGADVMVYDREK